MVDRTNPSNLGHFQIFYPFNNNRIYRRRWGGSDWLEWVVISPPAEKSFSHNFGSIPAKTTVNFDFDFQGAGTTDHVSFSSIGGFYQDGIIPIAHVPSWNTVRIKLQNWTDSSVTIGTRTVNVQVAKGAN